MKSTGFSAGRAAETPVVQWLWTNFRVSLLCLWAFLLGANVVQVAGALTAQEPWRGPVLGAIVSAGSIAWILFAARARREHET